MQNGEIYIPDLCLDAILEKAEKGLNEIKLAIDEARAASEERRYLIMRNSIEESDVDINIISDNGDFRLIVFIPGEKF